MTLAKRHPKLGLSTVALAVALIAALMWGPLFPAEAGHQPADKAGVAGSTDEIAVLVDNEDDEDEDGTQDSDEVVLFSKSLRTSSPTDLIIEVTAECSILTEVQTVGDQLSEAEGRVEVWVEIDGGPDEGGSTVPVGTEGDDGRVVFCNRIHEQQTQNFDGDDEDNTIRSYLETRNANAFNWLAFDLGSGVHTVEVVAELEANVNANALQAKALVGHRTLLVEPVKLANDADRSSS